jgi:4-coumarate--CoA ligase
MYVLIRERSIAVRAHLAGGDGRLKAFIVPDTDADTLPPLLQQVIATRLASHEQPRHLRFGDALPRNAMGKLKDWS